LGPPINNFDMLHDISGLFIFGLFPQFPTLFPTETKFLHNSLTAMKSEFFSRCNPI